MFEYKPSTFLSPEYAIKAASAAWEHRGAARLRRRVFCEEQKIFEEHDRDQVDEYAIPLVAISTIASERDEVVGTVRIHEEGDRIWWGSRLAVTKSHRGIGRLGTELIKLAVSSANGMGCDEFYAHVQMKNVPLFESLRWISLGEVDCFGQSHMRMQADLDFYPAYMSPTIGWMTPLRVHQCAA